MSLAAQLRRFRELLSDFQDPILAHGDPALETSNRQGEEFNPEATLSRLLYYRSRLTSMEEQAEQHERARRNMQQTSDSAGGSIMTNAGSRRQRNNRDSDSSTAGPRRSTDLNGLAALQIIAEQQLRAADSSIHNLLDDNNNGSPVLGSREPSSDNQTDRRRAKRVKLDSDDKREGIRGFSYGHYGQVVPGPLEMEIVSCDGGPYGTNGRNSWPENILLDDNSVYSAKSNRCNIILRHQGQTPFCLKKLVIKAPRAGLSGP